MEKCPVSEQGKVETLKKKNQISNGKIAEISKFQSWPNNCSETGHFSIMKKFNIYKSPQ